MTISFEVGRSLMLCLLLFCVPLSSSCDSLGGESSAAGDGSEEERAATDSTSTEAADADGERQAVPVETEPAMVGDISSYLLFSSTIETEAAVEVYPEVSGLVRRVAVEEGDHVAADETLVALDDDQARLEDLESQVNLRHLEAGFERMDEMYSRQLVSSQTYEDKQFELEQAKLRRARAKLALEHTVVRAPFSGVITSRNVQLGSRVAQSTKLFDLVKLDDLIAHVFVPGKHLLEVEPGQSVEVESHYQEGVVFDGQVKRISPVVDPRSGTFKVTVGLGDNWRDLRPGIFVNVRIITDTHRDAVLLPKQAIIYDGGERYVFVVADSVASRVQVDAGFENAHHVEARSLVQAGESIIVVGQSGLRDSTTVRVMNVDADSLSTGLSGNESSGDESTADNASAPDGAGQG